MIHKFTIECGGQRVPWFKVAAAAKSLGVSLPDKLPPGYAPVSRLKGRFVLPSFGPATPVPAVTSETLPRDAVIEPPAPRSEPAPASWVTVVDPVSASASAPAGSGDALAVAGVISTLLVSLMGGCLLLVRRRQFGFFEFSAGATGHGLFAARAWDLVSAPFFALWRTMESLQTSSGSGEGFDDATSGILVPVHTRLHETEYLIAMLPTDLLLRDVLASELDSLHNRVADLGRRAGQLGPERLRSAVRAVMRDLDRIGRIVEGAMPTQASDAQQASADSDIPTTAFEAYRVLGLNSNAPDAAVKKIVDALRMSWHPDHARDDADRRYREQRIKQINAAWDLLRVRPAAAA